jgi:alpha-1,3-rhamnosyl/mannosyltransferase
LPYTIGIDTRKIQDFGIGTYIRNLVRGLGEIDPDNRYVLITSPQARDALAADLPENFELTLETAPVYSLREQLSLSWKLYRLKLDLYHSTHYVLPAVVPSKVVATIHDIIHLLYPDFLPSRLALIYAHRMIRSTLGRADRIIAVSENTRRDVADHFEVSGEKIEVIYNGVDDVFRQPLSEEAIERWLKNLGVERPYLLFVGNPKPHKNLDNVVKAYGRARQLHSFEHRLVCVGARRGVEFKIQQRAEQLGLGDAIHLVGHVAQEALPALYQGAELFLYPTLYEGFGLPVIEAMASGTPVITSNTSALKEVGQGYAHLVDPLDVEAMAAAIVRCVSDDEYRTGLAKRGRKRAEDFHWRRTAEKTLALYRQVLGEGAGEEK